MKKATIRDIAEAAGVSISSVHLALNGKTGVSDATRERIKQIAEELSYRPSVLASNLKRDPRSVAVILPPRESGARYYYNQMWNALEDYAPVANDYNLTLESFVCGGTSELEGFDSNRYSGIISVGIEEYSRDDDFRQISQSGVPLVVVDDDVADSGRICCVESDADTVGRVTAELLVDMVRRVDGDILICGVGPSFENRRQIEEVICRELEPFGMGGRLRIMNYDREDGESFQGIRSALTGGLFAGACAVNSRSTRVLGDAVVAAGQRGFFPVIGSGLFEESRRFLRDGVMTALVDKRPYDQCMKAFSVMENLLVRDQQPAEERQHIKIDVIFRGTLDQYDTRTQSGK